MKSLNDVLMKMLDENGSERIPTGLIELDRILKGGLKLGGVTLVAGRPCMGKTSFLLDIAMYYMKTIGNKVAFFSDDDIEEFVALRVLGKTGKCAKEYLNIYGQCDFKRQKAKDGEKFRLSFDEVKNLPMLLYCNPRTTPYEIKDICEDIRGLGMIIIDTSLRCDMGGVTSEYIFRLSQIALNLRVPVICSCNVNRSIHFYDNHRPDFSSILGGGLRTGTVEPTVIALHRPDYYSSEKDGVTARIDLKYPPYCHPAEAIVLPFGGSSQGGGTADIMWNENSCSFENVPEYDSKQNGEEEDIAFHKHWLVFSDYESESTTHVRSKEEQYKNVIYTSRDSFTKAKEYFIGHMMDFDSDGVLKDIWGIMDGWEYKRGEITIEEVLQELMTNLNTEIDEQGYRASGYARMGKTASMWETFNFKYFNSKYHFTISKNCFEMGDPNDKYFFEVMQEEEGTGELRPYFYMELTPSI